MFDHFDSSILHLPLLILSISHAKYASFMRQVNGWGFKRIVSGNDHNSYYHELFLRDYPQLCLKMKRIRKGDKLSEAMEEKEEKSNEEDAIEAGGSAAGSNNGDGGEQKDDSEEDGNDEQNPPSNAVNAMLNNASGQNGMPVGLTSSMGQVGSTMNNALASLTGNNQNQGMNVANLSALTGMANQFQNQQQPAPQPPAPAPMSNGGIPGLDNAALMKLQEALQGGGGANFLLQQQQQPPPQQAPPQQQQQLQMPTGLGGLNMGNLSGFLGNNLTGALAAQLQAATQPPQQQQAPQNNDVTANASAGGNAPTAAPTSQTLQEMVAQLQQQQQQQQNNQPKGDNG